MKLKHTVEKPDGSFVFQGILEGAELKIVVEEGLNSLLAKGLFPFLVDDEEDGGEKFDYAKVMPNPGIEQ